MHVKSERVNNLKNYIESHEGILKACDELLPALKSHTGKLVDARFFEKHFLIPNEWNKKYTKYSLTKPSYSFEKPVQIYLGRHGNSSEKVGCDTRETSALIVAIEEKRAESIKWLDDAREKLAKVEALDVEAMLQDIKAVYLKYGKPDMWDNLMRSSEVWGSTLDR
jgi:hypothetical protein